MYFVVATILVSSLSLLLSKAWEQDNWSQRRVQRKEVRREFGIVTELLLCLKKTTNFPVLWRRGQGPQNENL